EGFAFFGFLQDLGNIARHRIRPSGPDLALDSGELILGQTDGDFRPRHTRIIPYTRSAEQRAAIHPQLVHPQPAPYNRLAMRSTRLLTLVWVTALAQPRPLRNLSMPRATHEISILRADLQDLKLAHGGPAYFNARRSPYRGQSEILEVSVFGQEAVAAI